MSSSQCVLGFVAGNSNAYVIITILWKHNMNVVTSQNIFICFIDTLEISPTGLCWFQNAIKPMKISIYISSSYNFSHFQEKDVFLLNFTEYTIPKWTIFRTFHLFPPRESNTLSSYSASVLQLLSRNWKGLMSQRRYFLSLHFSLKQMKANLQ